ncbi:hypothetical protein ABVV53_13775 [Novosphingobium sp. RD2P27]|uniref:Secreted protein n=1 Tax=Novosphingobium kalidii TaxID=3230299 RepID=A0ABV2D3Y2_9SPHN
MKFFSVACALAAVTTALGGCAVADTPTSLPEPNVVMAANPPPPFTYWAPVGSTIRNHPREADIWIAEVDGRPAEYYFGDQCHASQYQRFVGQHLDALPEKPANAIWRTACATCAVTSDLQRKRMNIAYEDDTREITAISCG